VGSRQRSLEALDVSNFWNNRRVLITGHTGFKGAWLTLWLGLHGAHVVGIALKPEQPPGLLEQFALTDEIEHHIIDIRDSEKLRQRVVDAQPEIVFHLAAQALVRRSYQRPADTWNTNVIGTINLMDSLRQLDSPFVAVVVTSDKVYLNRDWEYGYRETDALGGHDPYSSSKAAVEIAVVSWRQSFFTNPLGAAVATGRAGNVLGGGDWAEDRIVPDLIRSFTNGRELGIRNPAATRPWQHVLEPLAGYLQLAEHMKTAQQSGNFERSVELCSAWNFGPLPESNRTVQQLVETATEFWPGRWSDQSQADAPHEARFLGLSIEKACRSLNWYPRWNFRECVRRTIDWYRRVQDGENPRHVAEEQIGAYECNSGN
jgi:CDP-glucose 4,6-dehydratase